MSSDNRTRWEFEGPRQTFCHSHDIANDEMGDLEALSAIDQLLKCDGVTSYYQPVYSAVDGSVFGYEALARLNNMSVFADIQQMFNAAMTTGSLSALDMHCIETALKHLDVQRFVPSRAYLFLNACPETLMNAELLFISVRALLGNLGIPYERVVLEVTEENVISNYELFRHSLDNLRMLGFKIAIDDFGCGYAGLKMLSTIEPDFLKIDRHFIENIDRANIKFNLVQAIATACHRIGIRVVAEGIERNEELAIITDLGIELLQGFLLGRPSPRISPASSVVIGMHQNRLPSATASSTRKFVGDIVTSIEPLNPSDPIITAFRRFISSKKITAIPVACNDAVIGILNRNRFLENQILGTTGYGYSLNSTKRIADVMEKDLVTFEVTATLQEASQKIQSNAMIPSENLVVVKNGRYQGVLEVSLLLEALTEENILLARDSNPLSGLPGNNLIQREITRRLAQSMHFDTLYLDIDHFKPFNDHYGFAQGDRVIIALAAIIKETLFRYDNPFNFAGHIGGDDFIVIASPPIGLTVAKTIISEFARRLPEFHGQEDFLASCYIGVNRRGETEQFSLLSISVGIVSTEVCKISCYSQLASIACEVKKAAKQQPGSSIARDMRKLQPNSQGDGGECELLSQTSIAAV